MLHSSHICECLADSTNTSLAYAELFLTIAAVFRRFDLELFETTRDDVGLARDGFVPRPKAGSKGVQVIVRGEVS